MKNFFVCILAFVFGSVSLFSQTAEEIEKMVKDKAYYKKYMGQGITINVYNWGEYISDGSDESLNVNKAFEALTGIKVNYTTYASNEEMYVKLKMGGVSYDVIIPSDYMVGRLIKEDMVKKIDFAKVPNYININENFRNLNYDPSNEYSVPYTWGIQGIIYNKTMVHEEASKIDWNILFNEQYKKKILMFYNVRDAFSVALVKLGYSLNSTNENEIKAAGDLLKKQKPLVQAYVMDEIYDKMESGEAAIGVYYAGDSMTMMQNNSDLNFVIPLHSNRFIDAMCIPNGSSQYEAALMYINFMLEGEVGLANIEYIHYATPNDATYKLLPEDVKNNKLIYPTGEILSTSEIQISLPDSINSLMDSLWTDIITSDDASKGFTIPVILVGFAILCAIIVLQVKKRKKNGNNQ